MFSRVRELFSSLAIYGAGDVATQIVSVLLLPIYTRLLGPADYGVIALLLTMETIVKIVFRLGIDASFMRFYYDCRSQADRQRLASTIFWFLTMVDGALLAAGVAASPWLSPWLLGASGHTLTFALVLVNMFIGGFFFIPFHVMRIEKQPQRFIALTFTRSAATLVVRLALVAGLRMGVLGLWLADVVVSAAFCGLLWKWFAPLIRPVFSREVLRQALDFGLPRLPHGFAQQVMAAGDKWVMSRFVTLSELGLYSMGATIGLGLKLFMSAFEYAWAPFYFAAMKEPDAKQTFSGITTYAFAVLVLLATGLAAVAYDLVRLLMAPEYAPAFGVVPWIALGVVLQGIYLLTSIGLNITKHTRYYPVATAAAATTSIGMNFVLVPRYGIMGGAWANVIANAVLAGVAMACSQRFYPIAYEWRRLTSIVLAGGLSLTIVKLATPGWLPPIAGLVVRGGIVVIVFPVVLIFTRFFHANERQAFRALVARLRSRTRPVSPPIEQTVEMAGEIVAPPQDASDDVEEPS